jgi:DNA-binding response OmpR family regulator
MSTPPIVIIADKDQIVSNALRVEFNHRDVLVLLALTPSEAEDFASQTIASLLVLDVGGFGLPGYDACARIRRWPGYAHRPIILTSGKVTPQMEQASETAGATAVLQKSYSFADLVKMVLPHVSPSDPLLRNLRAGTEVGERKQQEWRRSGTLNWQFGNDSRLSGNARLMTVVRGAGVRIPVMKAT